MKSTFYFLAVLLLIGCKSNNKESTEKLIQPPIAKIESIELVNHGDTRVDDYFWMRLSDEQKNAKTPDDQTQDVLDYLNAENDYLEKVMRHTDSLQSLLYNEIVGRIKKDDESVPVNHNGYSYYTKFKEGNDYPLYCRSKTGSETEEIILNGPELSDGLAYFGMGDREVSTNNMLLAFAVDTISRRQYTIYFKNLETGNLLKDKLENTTGSAVWANDNTTVFYTTKDPETLRSNKIFKHVLGEPQEQDVLVYEEKDDTYRCAVFKSKSEAYIFIGSFQTLSNEYQFIDANNIDSEWKVIQPREKDLLYNVDHYANHFYIKTNIDDAKNFKLVETPIHATEKENWVDVIPHRDDVLLENFDLFKDYLVITERENGLKNIRIRNWDGTEHYLVFNDPTYLVYPISNLDFDTNTLRYNYSSLTTPMSTLEYNMKTKEEVLLKQEEVLDADFSPENYTSEHLFATATDGTKIPISIVYKKGISKSGNNPLLLYGYGSYGSSMDAYFNSSMLSLLDRGFIYAIAHIRGGEEMGRQWYEDGKLLNKKNTFTDFINCGEFLIERKFTSANHLYAMGGSAGGLLMGAIINMKPELWNGVIAAVPFVDVVSTMLDETIPLTTFEFDEWGNPKDSIYYNYIKSYSPYDNVEAKAYPSLLITTGYWDSQVQYWEPAKWIAKLRATKTDDNLLIMDCNMDVGHGGASGRFEKYKIRALQFAFLLDLEQEEEKVVLK
ncbi:S9 family peptidase [Formosa sp. PL04]|uniref:S9 family peptidase n=1 Tax=Formosa sp. PL04 TaxID=3081755 RepID=UPI0029825593|nr:S9 family peptidase [Formosa sp. PL04]MDW5288683.1 S9 family peptidase [Formosa sp. PL04]